MSVRQASSAAAPTPSSMGEETGPGWRTAASWTVWAALVLAVLGIGLAGYLAIENVQDKSGICTGVAKSCHTVQQSKYGKIAGVPVSVPGLLLYAGLAGLAVLWLTNFRGQRILCTQLALLGAFAGFAFSVCLTYRGVRARRPVRIAWSRLCSSRHCSCSGDIALSARRIPDRRQSARRRMNRRAR
jgi:uncharacterized membrane protein